MGDEVDHEDADPIFGQGRSSKEISENWKAAVVAVILFLACLIAVFALELFK